MIKIKKRAGRWNPPKGGSKIVQFYENLEVNAISEMTLEMNSEIISELRLLFTGT